MNFLDDCDTINSPHKFYNQSSHQRMCFYFGKNAFSALRSLLGRVKEFVSQQMELCIFRVRGFGYAHFYLSDQHFLLICASLLHS